MSLSPTRLSNIVTSMKYPCGPGGSHVSDPQKGVMLSLEGRVIVSSKQEIFTKFFLRGLDRVKGSLE